MDLAIEKTPLWHGHGGARNSTHYSICGYYLFMTDAGMIGTAQCPAPCPNLWWKICWAQTRLPSMPQMKTFLILDCATSVTQSKNYARAEGKEIPAGWLTVKMAAPKLMPNRSVTGQRRPRWRPWRIVRNRGLQGHRYATVVEILSAALQEAFLKALTGLKMVKSPIGWAIFMAIDIVHLRRWKNLKRPPAIF